MVDKWWAYLIICLFSVVSSNGEESFRTFTTADGKSFPFRVLSYEGQEFYFEDKNGKQYKVSYKQFSTADQQYLIDAAKNKKIHYLKKDNKLWLNMDYSAKHPGGKFLSNINLEYLQWCENSIK